MMTPQIPPHCSRNDPSSTDTVNHQLRLELYRTQLERHWFHRHLLRQQILSQLRRALHVNSES